MKPILFFIGACLLPVLALAQPKPAVPTVVATFTSPVVRLNTTRFMAAPLPAIVSRIDWTGDAGADMTVGAPTFTAKACVTAAKPVSRYVLFLNEKMMPSVRDLKVERDKDCSNSFSQIVQLVEGENRLRLVAYLTDGGEVAAPLVITYKKPPVLVLEKRLALVIGNADYPGSNKLGNPVNDANDMAASLRKLGFEVMQYTNLNNRTMREAINSFGDKLRDYQVGLFYYAGHGVQSKGRNYLVPLDAKPQSENEIEYDCLLADRILTKMEDARTRTNIVVLDACRNSPFERSWQRGGGRQRPGHDGRPHRVSYCLRHGTRQNGCRRQRP